jgi:phosphoglycolate phosphatase-like HAD superfamily hydrolase
MENKNLIVFDMDGVLIDVSKSYRDTVRETARLFFNIARSSECLPEPLFPLTDLAAIKQSGGLNNDWDLSCFIINLLFQTVENVHLSKSEDPWKRYQGTIGQCDMSMLSEFLGSTEIPLTTLREKYGEYKNPFIYSLYEGNVGRGNIIKQIFQEIYLGTALFKSTYNLTPQFHRKKGYIHRETLLIDKPILEKLAQTHILAIATGRPRSEAAYPLGHFNLKTYFRTVYSLEDCLEAEESILRKEGTSVSLSKPDPFMLDCIAQEQNERLNALYYIGDMPDDMIAARRSRAGYHGIGFLQSAPDKAGLRKVLLEAGADHIIEDFGQLLPLIAPG